MRTLGLLVAQIGCEQRVEIGRRRRRRLGRCVGRRRLGLDAARILSEERRRDLIKLIGKLAEDGRVALRHERRHGLEALKKEQKEGKITEDELSLGEKEVQKLTDQYTGKIEALVTGKEAELLKV